MLFLAMSILLILGKENKACSLEEEPKELTVSPNWKLMRNVSTSSIDIAKIISGRF